MTKRGNCYVTCEALYHLLKKAGSRAQMAGIKLKPMTVKHEGNVHWFLAFEIPLLAGLLILDPTGAQFKTPVPYEKGRGRGFLTKKPSKRARALMKKMLWQES